MTGGGSGHLPVFLGFVGVGLCSGVAVGNVFSSPSMDQILEATRGVDGGAGVLYLFGNYGGDVLNFELAAELADAEGITTATVLVADDVASAPAGAGGLATRRGRAVLRLQVRGCRRRGRRSLEEVAEAARHALAGDALDGRRAVADDPAGRRQADLRAGRRRDGDRDRHPWRAGRAARTARDRRRGRRRPAGRHRGGPRLVRGERVAVLVNGLGATPLEELYIVYRRVHGGLAGLGVEVARTYVGRVRDEPRDGRRVADRDARGRRGSWAGSTRRRPRRSYRGRDDRRRAAAAARSPPCRGSPRRATSCAISTPRSATATLASRSVTGRWPRPRPWPTCRPMRPRPTVLKTVGMTLARTNPSTFSALAMGALLAASKELGRRAGGRLRRPACGRRVPRPSRSRPAASPRSATRPSSTRWCRASTPPRPSPDAPLPAAITAAREGVDRTRDLVSQRGRAAWVGERTAGHADGGATAWVRVLEATPPSSTEPDVGATWPVTTRCSQFGRRHAPATPVDRASTRALIARRGPLATWHAPIRRTQRQVGAPPLSG